MNRLRKVLFIVLLCLSLLVLPFSSFANAATDSHYTQKNVIQYGLDGGITFSVLVKVSSSLTYSITSQSGMRLYNYSLSDASTSSASEYGLSACGTTLGIRKSTKFGSQTVSLPTQGTYIVEPGTHIIGYKSSGWTFTIDSPFTVNVENYGTATPNPSKCVGGSGVTDSFSLAH